MSDQTCLFWIGRASFKDFGHSIPICPTFGTLPKSQRWRFLVQVDRRILRAYRELSQTTVSAARMTRVGGSASFSGSSTLNTARVAAVGSDDARTGVPRPTWRGFVERLHPVVD